MYIFDGVKYGYSEFGTIYEWPLTGNFPNDFSTAAANYSWLILPAPETIIFEPT